MSTDPDLCAANFALCTTETLVKQLLADVVENFSYIVVYYYFFVPLSATKSIRQQS